MNHSALIDMLGINFLKWVLSKFLSDFPFPDKLEKNESTGKVKIICSGITIGWKLSTYVNSNFNRVQNWQMGKIIAVSFFSFFTFFSLQLTILREIKKFGKKTTKIYTVWLCKYYTVWKNEKTRLKDISWNQLLAS